jgi:hypothetical protein
MTPTKNNKGEFWWLDEGDGVPTVVQIDVATFGGEERVICRFVGWDIPSFVSSMEDVKWLGRAVPPEVSNAN